MRRPIDRPARITGDRTTHAAYEIGAATDYALPRGAWVIAPTDMTLTGYRSGTGGWSLQGRFGGGTIDFQHLIQSSRRAGAVAEGAQIAQVAGRYDDPGSMWNGDHLHTWVTAGGARLDFEEWLQSLGFVPALYRQIASPTVTSASGGNLRPIKKRRTPVLSITRVYRKGVGEHIMYASATTVTLTPELSMDAERRTFELGVAESLARAVGLDPEIPTLDDTHNGGWYLRNQLANRAAGMPADFPLAPDTPWTRDGGGGADLGPLLAAIRDVPTAAQNGAAARDAIVKP